MRYIDTHHDGHGLNESITIRADDPDGSGASHFYQMEIPSKDIENPSGVTVVCFAQFQKGPRNVEGSTPGVVEAALLAVLIDRLRGFQAGPYGCDENAVQLTKLEECLQLTKDRADARARRGVLGRNAK